MTEINRNERRGNQYLRDIFMEAYEIALPYIDPARGLYDQALVHQAYVILPEFFPFLTQQDLALLVPALQCIFRERNRSIGVANKAAKQILPNTK